MFGIFGFLIQKFRIFQLENIGKKKHLEFQAIKVENYKIH